MGPEKREAEPMLVLPVVLRLRLLDLAHVGLPKEVVGLLAGPRAERLDPLQAWPMQVTAIYPLENVALNAEQRFCADQAGLIRALASIRSDELELVAIYHSHPKGPAFPSQIDLQSAWDVPALIIDVPAQQLRAWWLTVPPREIGLLEI